MAGGWGRRGSGVPLSERVRGGPTEDTRPTEDTCPARHCWVADAVDGHGTKRPGLLVEWRHAEAGWEGRVAYAAHLRPDAWVLVEEWLPATLLTPR